jgi:translation initiation factor IF-3
VIYGTANAIMPTYKALAKAKELGLDLVEIAPNVRPPVCRIVDYGKWKYEQSKQKKNQKPTKKREKEVKFRVNIEEHDYNIKLTRAEDFLAAGFKVRMQLQFRGRQMAHKNLGFDLMNRVRVDLSGVANCDLEPKLSNRNIMMMLSPLPRERQVRKFRQNDAEIHDDEIDAHEAAEAEEDDHDPDEDTVDGELDDGADFDDEDDDEDYSEDE